MTQDKMIQIEIALGTSIPADIMFTRRSTKDRRMRERLEAGSVTAQL